MRVWRCRFCRVAVTWPDRECSDHKIVPDRGDKGALCRPSLQEPPRSGSPMPGASTREGEVRSAAASTPGAGAFPTPGSSAGGREPACPPAVAAAPGVPEDAA